MTGQKLWAIGEEVIASDFNNFVQTQVVAQFANVADRNTWSAPPNGALCVTLDTNTIWQRIGGVWTAIGPGPRAGGSWGRAANQSIPHATATTISFDQEVSDVGNFAPAMPATTFTVPTGFGGIYAMTFVYTWGSAATPNSYAGFVISGKSLQYRQPTDTAFGVGSVAIILALGDGATVQVSVFQNTGGARNITGALELWRVGV